MYSRIGVVEKGRQEQQTRRLIHDLRRSGVKQQVTMRERVRRPRGHSTLVTFDGSLSGGGATLQAGIVNFSTAHLKPMVAYWADSWTDEELAML